MAENTNVKEPIFWETFGWTEHTISSGTIYYCNTKTCETSWERPQDLQDEDTEKAGDWIRQKTEEEMNYYYNTITKESTWGTPARLRQQRLKQEKQFRRISKMHTEFGLQDVALPVPNEGKHHDFQNIKTWKTDLIEALKERYKQLFDAILPIPYIQDKAYCVNNIFIESVVELKTEMWSSLSSYHDVFTDSKVIGREKMLTGEPGFGKSTLTIQYAYDWYSKAKESYMKDVEILILLRLRQLHGVRSIFEAIRKFLLPENSLLTESKVEEAIRNSLSVVLILDGLDELPGDKAFSASIVNDLITGMFQKVEVLLTSRNYPYEFSRETRWLRLTGFDERAQEAYIRKAVAGDDEVAAEMIKQRLNESPILTDICKIPLFFAMFAHMTHEDKNIEAFPTVTSFFKCLIKCLYSHMRNKMDDTNVQISLVFEENHQELDKVAFESLIGKKTIWKKEELRERLGESLYKEYLTLGILIEEKVPYNVEETEVRFYQHHFCDWYGAHYIEHCASTFDSEQLNETLRHLTPLRNQYCYRFACGLNPQSANNIITRLKNNEKADTFAELCTIEQFGEVDTSLENVRDLCSRGIVLRRDDNKLKVGSTIQILDIASRHEIPIIRVELTDCNCRVDMSSNFLQLSFNYRLSVLPTIKNLTIEENGRKIGETEWKNFLSYLSKCLTLEEVKFNFCLVPQSLHPKFVSTLRLKTCQVSWYPGGRLNVLYTFCPYSGLWKLFGSSRKMSNKEYQMEVQKFNSRYGTNTEQS